MTNTLFPHYFYEPTHVRDDGRILWAASDDEPDTERRVVLARLLDRKRLELTDEEVAALRKRVDELSAPMLKRRREFRAEAEYIRSLEEYRS